MSKAVCNNLAKRLHGNIIDYATVNLEWLCADASGDDVTPCIYLEISAEDVSKVSKVLFDAKMLFVNTFYTVDFKISLVIISFYSRQSAFPTEVRTNVELNHEM